ncbi:hypothetical protein [Agitococcus lubricus]|uniref:START domain-containing protein n=1 Tax=Agitococcus lubricus TaxID=1077255 RepID=A0A2T5J0R0_9GAMM|nr:hypothetical protein [Agitococcus lubricus]PTQ89982.1 hypothetical protein C8N29_10420 [Agitococcus lubricus]
MRKLCFLLVLACTSLSVAADNTLDELRVRLDEHWHPVKVDKSRDIKTYAKREDGKPFRSFKIEQTIPTTMDTLSHILSDFDSYPRWFWETLETRLLKKVSSKELYVYMVHRAPLGIPNRDVILHVRVEPMTDKKNYAILHATAVSDYLPLKPPLVRMAAEEFVVRFTALNEQKVKLEIEGYIDPNGNVPVWATNYVQRSAPYVIAVGLQRMAKLDEFKNAKSMPSFTLVE